MKPRVWPFRPDHITNDGPEWDERELNKLTGEGVIPNEYLEGIQTSICANLAHPTAIIEFSPEGVPVRTDSRLLVYALHPPCSTFREHTDHKYCYECDDNHALLFRSLNRSNIATDLEMRIQSSVYIQDYVKVLGEVPQWRSEQDDGRGYLEYDCPLLGYRELLFPIFCEDRVIATFFEGEIALLYYLDIIPRRQQLFF